MAGGCASCGGLGLWLWLDLNLLSGYLFCAD
jgi:hypothetical protein